MNWNKFSDLKLDKNKKPRLITNGASSEGVDFVLFQFIDNLRQDLGSTIVAAYSSALKDSQNIYSPVDCELFVVKFAAAATHYYLYGCPVVYVYTDCSSLEGMFAKPLFEI